MVGDLLQDDEAGQDEAHRAPQPRVRLLAAAGPVPLALLCQTGHIQATPTSSRSSAVQQRQSLRSLQTSVLSASHLRGSRQLRDLSAHRISAVAQVEVRPQHASLLGVGPAGVRDVRRAFTQRAPFSTHSTACKKSLPVLLQLL